jgi:transposase InsO family protein
MEQRMLMISAWKSGLYSNEELFERFGVSSKTGYKWIVRYKAEGVEGLRDRSKAPRSCPHRTQEDVAEKIIEVRRRHPRWGPKKIVAVLRGRYPEMVWPAPSTAGDILKGADLVTPTRRRRREQVTARQLTQPLHPNDVWGMDFKGQFRLGVGRLCYPLTVSDLLSRYLPCCDAKRSTAIDGTRESLESVFREHGMPMVIRTDNGEPFASHGLSGLNRLNVWLMRLGVRHERIAPGHPEQNPEHERMHRELKAETARPPARNEERQQKRFDAFRATWNFERPHEALGQRPPALVWEPSTREFPEVLVEPDYAGHMEVRRVRSGGEIKFQGEMVFISQALAGELIGLEEVDDGVWSVNFAAFEVGRLDERTKKTYG